MIDYGFSPSSFFSLIALQSRPSRSLIERLRQASPFFFLRKEKVFLLLLEREKVSSPPLFFSLPALWIWIGI